MFRPRGVCAKQGTAGPTLAAVIVCVLALAAAASAQERCLKPERIDELKKLLAQAETENAALAKELADAALELRSAGNFAQYDSAGKPDEKYSAALAKARTKVCGYLAANPWPMTAAVGTDAASAFKSMVSKALPVAMQLEVYPVVAEALKLNKIERDAFLASLIDRLQLAVGGKQLFGTQAYVRDGLLVLAPVDQPSLVEGRRKEFNMEPLRVYEQALQATYRMPLVRSVGEPGTTVPTTAQNAAAEQTQKDASDITATVPGGGEDVIKVSTAFVTLDVVVSVPVTNAAAAGAAPLERGDFRVIDNGKPAEIETFSRADAPFDIVLLLDLSGSTAEQTGLIKKSTRRFVEMKRPVDRVAVVTFNDTQTVISELEADKAKLLSRVKDIEGNGASYVWDSLKFAMDMLDKQGDKDRRKAIVVMSDGVDNALSFSSSLGSDISFADLVEAVQRGSASIFPIYLDTESPRGGYNTKRNYANARTTLEYLAAQSAGKMYTAKKLEDVATLYDRVLNDVGTVYSVGFSPSEEIRDGRWRSVKVEIPSRPGLKIWHRPGYFPR